MTIEGPMPQEITWEELHVGLKLGPLEETITDELIQRYLTSVSSTSPVYATLQEDGSRIAPMAVVESLTFLLLQLQFQIRTRHGGLQSRMEAVYREPPLLGTVVRVEGCVVEKYEKRGKQYYVMEADARDDRGRDLASIRHTIAMLP
jgi:hypothetical protein